MEMTGLRPMERRVLRLVDAGINDAEIAGRFRRSPEFIGRVIELARLPGRVASADSRALRPVERCILSWRDQGAEYADIGPRLRRTPDFVERVESLARYKLSTRE
jgi:hypothetical protein